MQQGSATETLYRLERVVDARIELAEKRMKEKKAEGDSISALCYSEIRGELVNLRRWLQGEYKGGD